MPRSYTSILTHIVFSTYERTPLITSAIREPLHHYLIGIAANLDSHPIAIGGVADHIHLLTAVPPTIAVCDFVNKLKCNSSKWLHESRQAPNFQWQRGYGGFSVSRSVVPRVERYIANQERHHRKVPFRDEFVKMLVEAGIEFDERYLFV